MDIILLILAKPLDKHGTTLVHITYPPLISVSIFAVFSEIFTHVTGKKSFLLFIAGRVSIKKQQRGRESLATCARNKVLT